MRRTKAAKIRCGLGGSLLWLPPFFVQGVLCCVARAGILLRLVHRQRQLNRLEVGDGEIVRGDGGRSDCDVVGSR